MKSPWKMELKAVYCGSEIIEILAVFFLIHTFHDLPDDFRMYEFQRFLKQNKLTF